jgi:hypothetical protein
MNIEYVGFPGLGFGLILFVGGDETKKHGKTQMHYLQEDTPMKEIYLSPQVGDLNLLESL